MNCINFKVWCTSNPNDDVQMSLMNSYLDAVCPYTIADIELPLVADTEQCVNYCKVILKDLDDAAFLVLRGSGKYDGTQYRIIDSDVYIIVNWDISH